jgi:hypothetical protein
MCNTRVVVRVRAPFAAAVIITALTLAPRVARADSPTASLVTSDGAARATSTDMDKPHKRRSGIAMGFSLGAGLAGSSGYPNDSTKIDVAGYYSQSDLLFGAGGSLFVMGALADYLNFGFWFGRASYGSSDWRSSGSGGGFRVEGFPLYVLVPKLRDLGIFTQLGLGSTSLEVKSTTASYPKADGVQSFIGAGAFYEWRLFDMIGGHVAAGPSLEYDVTYSRSIERHGVLAGGRLVFYGGP